MLRRLTLTIPLALLALTAARGHVHAHVGRRVKARVKESGPAARIRSACGRARNRGEDRRESLPTVPGTMLRSRAVSDGLKGAM
jgi:hypothetical protein